MGAVLGFSCKPASPQKKYTAEARDKLVKAGGGERKNNACLLLLLFSKKLLCSQTDNTLTDFPHQIRL